MTIPDSDSGVGRTAIARLQDSEYAGEILELLSTRTPAAVVYNAVLFINLISFLAIVMSHFGLGLAQVAIYLAVAYVLIALSAGVQIVIYRLRAGGRNSPLYISLLEDVAIWSVLAIVAESEQTANPVLILGLVFVAILVTSGVTARPFLGYLISKVSFSLAVYCYCFYILDGVAAAATIVFPITVALVFLFAFGYWHYIKELRLLHLACAERHLREELVQKNTELVNEHRLRDKLIRHIGHDLRQPINSVSFALFNLKRSGLAEPFRQHLDIATHSIDSANCLIEDILQISSYRKQSQIVVNRENFCLDGVLRDIRREYDFVAAQAGCEFRVVTSSVIVHSDREIVTRILRNFLSNAVRYAAGSRILLGVRRRPGSVDIQVVDGGPGMTEDLQQQVFKEFTQGERSRQLGGFGLGLNIAKHLSAAIGAGVTLSSAAGTGTVCTLSLPLETDTGSAAAT